MKKIGIILSFIGIILLLAGWGYYLKKDNTSTPKEEGKIPKVNIGKNKVTDKVKIEDFKKFAKSLGYTNPKCQTNTYETKKASCYAEKSNVNEKDYKDFLSFEYTENILKSVSQSQYFSSKDFNAEKIATQTNKVMLNFFGTGLDQKNIKKCMKELEKDMSSDYPVGQIEFQVGNYTEQINMQYLKDKKIYLVRYLVIETTEYQPSN